MKTTILCLFVAGVCLASCSKNNSGGSSQGKILYQNNFDKDDGNWSLDNYDSIDVSLSGGFYQIHNQKYNYLWEETTIPFFDTVTSNIAVETKFTMAKDANIDYGGGGLLWGCDTGDIAYFFDIYTDGYYEIFGFPDGSTYKQYSSEQVSDVVNATGSNVLRIELKDGVLHFLVNSKEVFNMPSGGVGLDESGIATEGQSSVKVDYFKALQIP